MAGFEGEDGAFDASAEWAGDGCGWGGGAGGCSGWVIFVWFRVTDLG